MSFPVFDFLAKRAELGPDNSRVEIIPVQVIDAAGDFTHFDLAQGLVYAAGLPASNGVGGTVSMPRADIANMSLSTYNLSVTLFMAAQMAHAQGLLMVAAAGNENQAGVSYPAAFPEGIRCVCSDLGLFGLSVRRRCELYRRLRRLQSLRALVGYLVRRAPGHGDGGPVQGARRFAHRLGRAGSAPPD